VCWQDAAGKRFAMMNEVGLTCDEATELVRHYTFS
jgi:hypothetical protein